MWTRKKTGGGGEGCGGGGGGGVEEEEGEKMGKRRKGCTRVVVLEDIEHLFGGFHIRHSRGLTAVLEVNYQHELLMIPRITRRKCKEGDRESESPHGVYYISPLMTEHMLNVYLYHVLAK